MKTLSILAIILLSSCTWAQYEIGHTTITFNDPSRTGGYGSGGGTGRQIQTEIYYPAVIAGENVTVANGTFPTVVFGHGFAMIWSAYDNIWETLVPEGYILAFPRTEGSMIPSPSHEDFGLDLVIVEEKLAILNDDNASLFYNKISDKSAIMGHSMGGGSSILAAANNTSITTVIGFAPAETTPSAIDDAANVTVPALIFTADQDFVTPSADHHLPIYNGLNSSCKYYINIAGGGHCYYANPNINCDFGESTSGGSINITRLEQQTIVFRYLIPWLDMYLKDACEKDVFEIDLAADPDVSFLSSCSSLPSPSYDLTLSVSVGTITVAEAGVEYQWIDCLNGNVMISGANGQSFTPSSSGQYAVIVGTGACADTSSCHEISILGMNAFQSPDKQIFKVYDLTGREVPMQTNTLLTILYTDGTVEKVYIIE